MAILAAHDAATAATAATAVDPGDADHDRALVDRDANLHAVRRGRRTGSARRRLLGS